LKERKEEEREKEVTRVLTDEELSAIKVMLEKDHAIGCIFLLRMNKGRWGKADEFMNDKLKQHLSDGTYRSRMMEMEMRELATHKHIRGDPKKKHYFITDFGIKVADALIDFFNQIQ